MRIGVLGYPGCFASEVYGVPDLLRMAHHVAAATNPARTPHEVTIVSPRRHVVASGGSALDVSPPGTLDVLVVPGFELSPTLDLDPVLAGLRPEVACIRERAAAGVAVVSICVGAFLVAEAGLLDGREATTSWLFADRLAHRYTRVTVRPDRLVVTDDGVTTTAAFSAMYDLALHLIREHDGPHVARGTARIALVDDARAAQTPYVDAALLPDPGQRFSLDVKRWLRRHLGDRYDLPALARAFHVSTRTLLRRFHHEAGETPLSYLQSVRVRRARLLLETTDRTVASIATEVGYRDPGTFSTLFARRTGHRPTEYRTAFQPADRPTTTGTAPVSAPPDVGRSA